MRKHPANGDADDLKWKANLVIYLLLQLVDVGMLAWLLLCAGMQGTVTLLLHCLQRRLAAGARLLRNLWAEEQYSV